MAVPEASASRQPRLPQGQGGPSGQTVAWPISPARSRRPRYRLAVQNQARADAGAHRQKGHVPAADARAPAMLGQRRRIGVVLHRRRQTELGFQQIFQRHGVPARQVRRRVDDAGRRVQRAAAGDAEGGGVRRHTAALGAGLPERGRRGNERPRASRRGVGPATRARTVPCSVADHGRRLGAADVQAEQKRRGATSRLRGPAGRDVAVRHRRFVLAATAPGASPSAMPCCVMALGMPLLGRGRAARAGDWVASR